MLFVCSLVQNSEAAAGARVLGDREQQTKDYAIHALDPDHASQESAKRVTDL